MIAHAFGVNNLRAEYARGLTAQEKRWEVLGSLPSGSELRLILLEQIIQNCTDQDGRWKVFDSAPSGSTPERMAINAILENANKDDLEQMFCSLPVYTASCERILKQLLECATSLNDLAFVIENAPEGSESWKDAIRRYVHLSLYDSGTPAEVNEG